MTETKERFSAKLLSALLALVLAVGLMPLLPAQQAWAEDGTVKVSCTVIGVDAQGNPVTWATAADKEVAAGTTAADLSESVFVANSLTADYGVGSWGWSLNSITDPADSSRTLAYDAETGKYWQLFQNGASSWLGAGDITLAEGDSVVWFYSAYGDALPQEKETPAEPEEDKTTSTAGAYTAEKASTLISNLAARFVKGGKDASISNSTVWAALALKAQGKGSSLDSEAILAALAQSETDPYFSAGTLAKYVLALNTAGVDCTAVVVDNSTKTTRNLVKEMVDTMGNPSAVDVWSAVCILPALDAAAKGTVDQSVIDGLVAAIVAGQDSTGLFGGWGFTDSQTTAQAILALQGHGQGEAVQRGLTALKGLQLRDGGFAYDASQTESNLDATATVVAALAAAGIDPLSLKYEDAAAPLSLQSADGSTPLDYLLNAADATLDGYEDATLANESMSSATVLMGLVANAGYQQKGKAFNVYQDALTTDSGSNSGSKSTGSSTAKTGDTTAPLTVSVLALGAFATLLAAQRRKDQTGSDN